MIVYDGLKSDFLRSVEQDLIAIEINNNILKKMGKKTGKAEFDSWNNSMNYMYRVLNDSEIPDDCGVAIEYNIPQTSKRVDFILSGYDRDDHFNVVVVELKQWEELKMVDGVDALVETYTGGGIRRVVHPSYQAWSYAQLINDYNATVQDEHILIHPCAYLHNYIREDVDPLDDELYEDYLEEAPAYTKGQNDALRAFIKKSIVKGDNKEVLYKIDHGKIRPSKSLQDLVGSMLKGNKEFTMIDEQKVAYEEILRLSKLSQEDMKKRTIIVRGGPGTGKTVIAINLLAQLTMEGQMVQYVSKNSAPRQVYLKLLKGQYRKASVDNMFKGSGSYTDVGENVIHTLLVDEAHRLNEKSGMYHTNGENQIKEIIHASYCSVFFIDEEQRVTLNDIGSVKEIEKWAAEAGSEVHYLDLISQFRCNGSDGYLAWLDNVLDIRETANYDLGGIDYDIQVLDSPEKVKELIIEKNQVDNKSRMVAGYCWNWNSKEKNNTNYHDVKIGDFEMSWNLGDNEPFAIGKNSINEIGCIHTTQGLEFEYVGVIIGDDLRYENGKIVTDFTKRAKTDQSLRGIKKMYDNNAQEALKVSDEIIKNTYRTLMTRGMKGCYIYCTDDGLRDYLKNRLENMKYESGNYSENTKIQR